MQTKNTFKLLFLPACYLLLPSVQSIGLAQSVRSEMSFEKEAAHTIRMLKEKHYSILKFQILTLENGHEIDFNFSPLDKGKYELIAVAEKNTPLLQLTDHCQGVFDAPTDIAWKSSTSSHLSFLLKETKRCALNIQLQVQGDLTEAEKLIVVLARLSK